ncbi:unnamed protein product [Phytophthora lilii]|uniref:Unnamed protein product n=1 Tax=Phytophthora lilii TaxID=2077276 RepID=A0A9W6U2S6_9STRA|nr:unnamed protein product [Phytophthora lilii]
MFRQVSILAAVLPAMALAGGVASYTGDSKSYTLAQVSAGACNFMFDSGVGENYAALNGNLWDAALNCGRCAEVTCDDFRCNDNTATATVYIVDKCEDCEDGGLNVSPTVFKQLTGSSETSSYSLKWKFVDCPVTGNIQYCTKAGSTSSSLAVQPANFATGVASVKISNQDVNMGDAAFYFSLTGGNVDMSAVDITVTSVSGETITDKVSLTVGNCTAGSSNFKASAAQSSTQEQSGFNTLKSGTSNTYQAGTVTAADESSDGVSILQSSEGGVEKTPSTQQQDDDAEKANTKSAELSKGTSPVIVALVVLAVVGGIALAAVAYTVKKKKLDNKRIDRDDNLTRSFDTFSSPVRIKSTIAKI